MLEGYVGIHDGLVAIPPETEVQAADWLYHGCSLQLSRPIDYRTLSHLSNSQVADHQCCHGTLLDTIYFDQLPKKMKQSILLSGKTPNDFFGWGVHIVEGPNKPVIARFVAGIVLISSVVALVYDLVRHENGFGFATGQWIVAVLSTGLAALYFHMEDIG